LNDLKGFSTSMTSSLTQSSSLTVPEALTLSTIPNQPFLAGSPNTQGAHSPEMLHGLWAEKRFQQLVSSSKFRLGQGFKRVFDITAASLGLLALLPVLCVIALLVKLTSPEGPILYKSRRIGKNQQPFNMYKFRTMIPNADKLREELRRQNQQEGQLFKLKHDPRVTPLGAFLRKYSLDEFPQLLNVIKGDMSLVGPRPFSPDNCELFSWPYTLRFRLQPGITGMWQVNGRSNVTDFEQVCKMELNYVTGWNLWHDGIILLKTIPAVLLKKGSC
jgi:lipopolysaccharide/colanic/teichoic acid biosynthesis glycosyltransferase